MGTKDFKLEAGSKVKTAEVLRACISEVLPHGFTKCRRPGINGTVRGVILGSEGELFFVEHDDKSKATYHHTELLEVLFPQCQPITHSKLMKLEIEVIERGGAPGKPSYHAQLKGDPKIWACGSTPNEAIGDLVNSHQETFGITITSHVKPKA